jgi:hypothetical protein
MATVAQQQKILQTSSNEVFFPDANNYNSWKQDVNQYISSKTNFQGKPDPYRKVTHREVKAVETLYNPITQVYKNAETETRARHAEQDNFIQTLAKNKDRALRYEQTYNVLNFENKLAGLENRPDYPKEKPWYFRPERDSLVGYNIITNHSLKDHYFDAPEKRPEVTEQQEVVKQKPLTDFKDYNIITNRYLEFHDDKVAADEQILRAEAAKKYWKTHDFDPLNCQYYDEEKESEFKVKRANQAKEHGKDQVKKLPLSVQNEGLMYNPVNMKIEDEQRLQEKDQREKNKKARYQVRYQFDKNTREESQVEQDR